MHNHRKKAHLGCAIVANNEVDCVQGQEVGHKAIIFIMVLCY